LFKIKIKQNSQQETFFRPDFQKPPKVKFISKKM